ncbi:MAG: rane protein of unknown function [Candidatus Saccharibacteria bacterium]|nr:rane protein of unknown function [Candidatus Saccharibacteria bacterium]
MIPGLYTQFAAACSGGSFFGFPTWYKYLSCGPDNTPQLNNINNVWLVGAAVIELLIRLGALLAIGFVIYGAIGFVTSQGEPNKTAEARHTIIDALVGLIIAVAATTILSYIAGRFNG